MAFDASGFMVGALGSHTKIDAAKQAVVALLDDLPDEVTASLIAFPHKGTHDDAGRADTCAGIETLVPITDDTASVQTAAEALEPAPAGRTLPMRWWPRALSRHRQRQSAGRSSTSFRTERRPAAAIRSRKPAPCMPATSGGSSTSWG
ncbi:VWA domain-containing protein [Paracoccus sanguinis]|uniref:VWA domain-containing protein n=1 Tax=Paracoccus sanguinis TaxID=1545044 RepID=UPI001B8C315B|nr:VWA domain-containing protein [Paracoccus sanguinis]